MHAERSLSLTELVTNRLRQEIVLGHFELGDGLSESRIAQRYGVSRTPVREAFNRLEQEGLVRTEPQSGTYVFTMNLLEFTAFSETRSILEVGALRIAMQRNPEALANAWRDIAEQMITAMNENDKALYSASDSVFHEALFIHADNEYLDLARRPFTAKMDTIRNKLGATTEHMAKSFGEHVALRDAVARKDVDAAVVMLDQHIRHKGAEFWTVPEVLADTRWNRMRRLAEASTNMKVRK